MKVMGWVGVEEVTWIRVFGLDNDDGVGRVDVGYDDNWKQSYNWLWEGI